MYYHMDLKKMLGLYLHDSKCSCKPYHNIGNWRILQLLWLLIKPTVHVIGVHSSKHNQNYCYINTQVQWCKSHVYLSTSLPCQIPYQFSIFHWQDSSHKFYSYHSWAYYAHQVTIGEYQWYRNTTSVIFFIQCRHQYNSKLSPEHLNRNTLN